jgi:hypothetical protein
MPEDNNAENRADVQDLKDRIHSLETAVEHLSGQVESLVHIFTAAQGFFQVLEFLGKILKPVLVLGGLFAAAATALSRYKTGS